MLTGTALTAVGCGGDSSGACVGGLITLPLGLIGLAPSIYMIHDSRPRVAVDSLAPGAPLGEPPLAP